VSVVQTAMIVVLVAQFGCAMNFDRGTLAAVSTKAVDLPMTIVREHVEGKYCQFWGDDRAFARAVEDALRKVPDANALANANYLFNGNCVLIRGMAVHVE